VPRSLPVLAALTALAWWLYLGTEGNGWLTGASALGLVLMGVVGRPWWLALLLGEAVAVPGLVLADAVFWNSEVPDDYTSSCDPGCISLAGGVILVTIAVVVLTSVGVFARLIYRLIRRRPGAAAA
jgi:hypothetical protein